MPAPSLCRCAVHPIVFPSSGRGTPTASGRFNRENTNADPAPTAKPPANAERVPEPTTETIAPAATRPRRSSRETSTGGTRPFMNDVLCPSYLLSSLDEGGNDERQNYLHSSSLGRSGPRPFRPGAGSQERRRRQGERDHRVPEPRGRGPHP